MASGLPQVFLIRHGETAWSLSRQHTGLTDIALTPRGEENAHRLGLELRGRPMTRVFSSPLQRARRTAELAGFPQAEVDSDLVEWDYGDYEGLTSVQIHVLRPDWRVFVHGCPGGESVADVSARADRVIAKLRAAGGQIGIFSSGHFSRVLAARWLGLDASFGRFFLLGTTTLSILGYEHSECEPVLRLWNDERPGLHRGIQQEKG